VLSCEKIQVFFVLNLPACLGQLLVDTHTGTRLRGKKAGTVPITHGVANVTDTEPIFACDSSALRPPSVATRQWQAQSPVDT
jgi:hypothetical protein